MSIKTIFLGLVLITISAFTQAATYYVATDGLDTNAGTLAAPFKTVEKAIALTQPGDSILLRGGTYYGTALVTIANSGTAGNMIFLGAYNNEKPVFDYSKATFADADSRNALRAFFVTGSYWHIKGIEFCYAPDCGMKLEGNFCIIEQCHFHHNGDTGLQVGLKSNAINDGTKASNNLILNCDAHHNCDPWNGGENADGFACKLFPGAGNVFDGCRAWENSDDGWDLYETEYDIILKNCWTWNNGNPASWNASEYPNGCRTAYSTIATWNGDGNGYKLGGAGFAGGHTIHHSIAFNHQQQYSRGFHQNNNGSGIEVYNCTGWGNTTNFGFMDNVTVTKVHDLKNNLAFDFFPHPKQSGAANARLLAGSISENNSWDAATGVTATSADVISTDVNLALAPREADGSLPNNGFGRLTSNSDCLNKGKTISYEFLGKTIPLQFCGAAPDLGAYEYECAPSSIEESNASNFEMILTPSIVENVATLTINATIAGVAQINIVNILGVNIITIENKIITEGENSVQLNLGDLQKGIYFCTVVTNGNKYTNRFIKK